MDTPDLFPAAADPSWLVWPRSRLERRFAAFHAANPHVWAEVERRALALHRAGARRVGIALIFEAMRYDRLVTTTGEPWKMNNSYRALYARLLIARHPELAEVIEVRRRKEAA